VDDEAGNLVRAGRAGPSTTSRKHGESTFPVWAPYFVSPNSARLLENRPTSFHWSDPGGRKFRFASGPLLARRPAYLQTSFQAHNPPHGHGRPALTIHDGCRFDAVAMIRPSRPN